MSKRDILKMGRLLALCVSVEPRSHDDLPSVPTPPRIDSTSY